MSTSAAAGVTAYCKMAAADVVHFRIGHVAILRDASDYAVDVNAKVTSVVTNGDNSYVSCKLLEAANSGSSTDITDVDTLLVAGNLNPEGGSRPDAIAYDPVKWNNYTQIFRTPLSIETRLCRPSLLVKVTMSGRLEAPQIISKLDGSCSGLTR